MNSNRKNLESETYSPIFIVGLPRSGSTLWSNVIARNPDVTFFTEMHFLNPWPWHKDFRYLFKQVGDLRQDANVARLVEEMFMEPLSMGLRRGPYFWRQIRELRDAGLAEAVTRRIQTSEERDIGFVFRALIEEATNARKMKRAAVKFPVYPAYIDRLDDWWPESRIVHITRDPRSIAASKTNDPGGTGKLKQRYPLLQQFLPYAGISYATIQYAWASRAHARMVGRPNYRLFMYENLMRDPEATVRELCEFCRLVYDDSMLQPDPGQASSITGHKSSGFDPSRMHGWQKKLKPWQSKTIAYVSRGSMRRFGYEPD